MSALLAVDGGQTALRLAAVEGGRVAGVAEVGGFSHGAGDGGRALAAAVAEARDRLGVVEPVARICLGLTGAPAPPELRRRFAGLVADALGGADVALGPDMVTAHAGALAGEPGVVVAAGTGVVVLGVATDGTAHRADGLGYLLGDDGSGFAVGQAGVRAALRAREGRGPDTALTAAAEAFFDGLDDLSRRVHATGAPAGALAAFTPEVAAVARAGDAVARSIWADAAAHLVTTTASVVRRTFPGARAGSVAVSHTGRLFLQRDLLLEPVKAGLAADCPATRYQTPRGDALDGAARLVDGGLGRYAPLVCTTEGWSA